MTLKEKIRRILDVVGSNDLAIDLIEDALASEVNKAVEVIRAKEAEMDRQRMGARLRQRRHRDRLKERDPSRDSNVTVTVTPPPPQVPPHSPPLESPSYAPPPPPPPTFSPVAEPKASKPRKPKVPRVYTPQFEAGWKLYGRGEDKPEAFDEWQIAAAEEGGEDLLLEQVKAALKRQAPKWDAEKWEYAPYFRRYLKRRRYREDLKPATGPPAAKPDPLCRFHGETYRNRDKPAFRPDPSCSDCKHLAASRRTRESEPTPADFEAMT